MQNPHDQQRKDYEAHARKIWGHDADPLNADANAAIVPAVTIIADAANAPAQSDDHGSAGEIDNTVPTTSAAPAVKDGKTQAAIPEARPGALPIVDISAGKSPLAGIGNIGNLGNEEMTPESAYRKAWGNI
jgi:hypothetical protein